MAAGISGTASGVPKSGRATSASRAAVLASSLPRRSCRWNPEPWLRSPALDRGEPVSVELQPRARLPVRPQDADLGAVGLAQSEVDPAELPPGPAPPPPPPPP